MLYAVDRPRIDVLRLLLEARADVNNGETLKKLWAGIIGFLREGLGIRV